MLLTATFWVTSLFGTDLATLPPNESLQPASASQTTSDWFYNVQRNERTNAPILAAQVTSSNAFEFNFPHQGQQHADLVLYKGHGDALHALLVVERGQFSCNNIDECRVAIRADYGPTTDFKISAPGGNPENERFIENPQLLSDLLVGAKRLRIEATFYRQGRRVLDFAVSGFRPELQ
jgi:hypothetical protein